MKPCRIAMMAATLALVAIPSSKAVAQEPVPKPPACGADSAKHRLPFTSKQNADGARYVWFISCRAGLPYAYIPTAKVPRSRDFTAVDSTTPGGIRQGDIAWWPKFMVLVAGPKGPAMIQGGPIPLQRLIDRYGRPRFFRRIVRR